MYRNFGFLFRKLPSEEINCNQINSLQGLLWKVNIKNKHEMLKIHPTYKEVLCASEINAFIFFRNISIAKSDMNWKF